MNTLYFAFYGEGGGSEYLFLKHLVWRTLETMLPNTEVLEPKDIYVHQVTQVEKLIAAAQEARGYSFLVVHMDADYRNWERAYKERFQPGIEQARNTTDAIQDIVPIIPIRMTEAWTLVDFDAFRRSTDTEATAEVSGFPNRPHQVEAIQHPKQILNAALTNAVSGRRRQITIGDIYHQLAGEIDLARLERVPAYQRFVEAIEEVLTTAQHLRGLGYQRDT